MFEIGSEIMYGLNGVCRIVDIRNENFGEEERLYYVMNPLRDSDATIYVPVNNPKSVSRMKAILTKEEVFALIHSIPGEEMYDEKNSKIRKELFNQVLKGGDRTELIKLIKTVYNSKREREKMGKKVWVADETAMKKAEKMLYEEIATVLDLKYEEVQPFIRDELEQA